MREASRKEHLVATAGRLFDAHGYHQVGVDLIMRESGVSKTTLYKHFASKEDLIVEVLRRRSEHVLARMKSALKRIEAERPEAAPAQRLAAITADLMAWIEGGAYFGCNFVRAASEYQSPGHPVQAQARAHKAAVSALVAEAVGDQDAPAIMLVLEGALATALVSDPKSAAETARNAISWILNRHERPFDGERAATRNLEART
jgi:AcrR family transcriptional regulator